MNIDNTVMVGNEKFSFSIVRNGGDSEKNYIKENGGEKWGEIKIEGEWLFWTTDDKICCHSKIHDAGLAYHYGRAVPMDQSGIEMACKRIRWIAEKDPEALKKWIYLRDERRARMDVGTVTFEEIQRPFITMKPWIEGANPHPDAVVYDIPGKKGSLPWWWSLTTPDGTPNGHPRWACHFPSYIPKDEWFGKKTRVKAKVWRVAHKNDNGPGWNHTSTEVEVIEGEFKSVRLAKKAVGSHFESVAAKDSEEIGWFGKIPEAPEPPQPLPPYKKGEVCPLGNHGRETTSHGQVIEVEVDLYIYWTDPVNVILVKTQA